MTVTVRRAPSAVVAALARLPGVEAIEGRISDIVEVEQEHGRRPRVIGRLISMPDNREPRVNKLKLLAGRPLGSRGEREVLLETQFAAANGYRPGDRIYPRFQGRRARSPSPASSPARSSSIRCSARSSSCRCPACSARCSFPKRRSGR